VTGTEQVFVAEGFTPPGPGDFNLPPIFGNSIVFSKPALQLVLAAALVFGFFMVTSRRMAAGVQAPRKKRRPAPGAYGSDYTGPRPAGGQSADIDSDTPE